MSGTSFTPQPDPLVGQTIGGKYVVDAILGRGGMGVVYLAHHHTLRKKFVIKTMLAAQINVDSENAIERFRREAQAIASIEHPNVVAVVDYDFLEDMTPYLVMEFVEGVTLDQFQKDYPQGMPMEMVVAFVSQMCDAMSCVHENGVVHRDLKPSNIMIQTTGSAYHLKILDFGLASLSAGMDETAWMKLTSTGQILGTPAYMSPEQCKEEEITPSADIYALGLLAYEMLAGKPAFHARTFFEMVRLQTREQPPSLSKLRIDLPRSLVLAVEKALQKDPRNRFLSMNAFSEAFCRGMSGSLSRFSISFSVVKAATRRSRPALRWSGVGVLLALGSLLAWSWFSQPAASREESEVPAGVSSPQPRDLVTGLFVKRHEFTMTDASTAPGTDMIPLLSFNRLVSVYRSGLIVIWDASSGVVLQRIKPYDEEPSKVFFSGDGTALFVAHPGGRRLVRVDMETFDVEEENLSNVLPGDEYIRGVAQSPRVVAGDAPVRAVLVAKRILLFREGENSPSNEIPLDFESRGADMRFSPSGKLLSCVFTERRVKVFSLPQGEVALDASFKGEGWALAQAFSDDETQFALGTRGNAVLLFDLEEGEQVARYAEHTSWVVGLGFLPESRGLLSFSNRGELHHLSIPDLRRLDGQDLGPGVMALFAPYGGLVIQDGETRKVSTYAYRDPSLMAEVQLDQAEAWAFTLSGDGRYAYVGSPDRSIAVVDLETMQQTHHWIAHDDGVTSLAVARDGQRLLSASDDFSLALWDVPSETRLKSVKAHEDLVNSVVLDPSERFCVTTSSDRMQKVWRFPDLEFIQNLDPMPSAAQGQALSDSGEIYVSGDWAGHVGMWDTETWEVMFMGRLVDQPIYWIRFFPGEERRFFISSLHGGGSYVVTIEGSEMRAQLLADLGSLDTPTHAFSSLAGRPPLLAVACPEFIEIYDVASLQKRYTILGVHAPGVPCFRPTTRQLFCAVGRGMIMAWDLASIESEPRKTPRD